MIPIEGQPILTAEAMRAAEAAAAPTPDAMYALMERAGAGVADAVRRVSGGAEVLVLCGPGNNGGDGYVAARLLQASGVKVRVAALTPPRTALARRARAGWTGETDTYMTGDQARTDQPGWKGRTVVGAPIVVDALFGTGGRADHVGEAWLRAFLPFFAEARYRVAVDLPLGRTAAGERTGPHDVPAADLTLALCALKPVHVTPSGRTACGEVRLIDLGFGGIDAAVRVLDRPKRIDPRAGTHKYTRGMVGVVAGKMPGAAILAATAAARAGAGYVAVFGDAVGGPAALVHRALSDEALADERLDVVVIGPGLGRDAAARRRLEWLLCETRHPLVIDGDAIHLLDPRWLKDRHGGVVLTPHGGEHRVLIAALGRDVRVPGDPFATAMAEIAALGGAWDVMVAKGATTVVADHRQAYVAPGGNPWLSTAGTGDVLAGAIAASIAGGRHRGVSLVDAAAAGVWLHADAARRCGAGFVADDLAGALTAARAGL